MKKNAFTLIELLAVIVILAIISLIAVPIVINIINDSKNSSDEQSVELYLDTVEKTITKKQLSNPSFNPDRCIIKSNGDLECFKEEISLGIINIDMKGQIPEKGIIELNDNKIKYKNIWFNDKKYYAIATLISDADDNNEISIGDKYSYKVNEKDTFKFYVLTNPLDGKVNLIMDRNICEDGKTKYTEENNYCRYAWYDDGDNPVNYNNDRHYYGPVIVMTKLYNATKNWTNVKYMDLSGTNAYEDEGHKEKASSGYGKIETTKYGIKITTKEGIEVTTINNSSPSIIYDNGKKLKARLPMYKEVRGNPYVICTQLSGSCPVWLIENLSYWNGADDKYSINNNSEPYQDKIFGYWLLSSRPSNTGIGLGDTSARSIDYLGRIDYWNTSNVTMYGIRPVITVPISDLE